MSDKFIFGIKEDEDGLNDCLSTQKDFSALNWDSFFAHKFSVPYENGSFNVYTTDPAGSPNKPFFLLLHGAGMSGLSFALLARSLKDEAYLASFDLRNHGETSVEPHLDLSLETLANDAALILETLNKENRPVFLLGHSLGGAIAVRLAKRKEVKLNVIGVIVIDLVEGSAIAALPQMKYLLQAQPASFDSVEEAIRWSVTDDSRRDLESMRVSIPSRLCPSLKGGRLEWRTDLFSTERFWEDWFRGLSNDYLSLNAAKLLILADTDRLDRTMTIAQMQGKYQMEVLLGAGHEVHENRSKSVANILLNFSKRYSRNVSS